MDEKLTARQQEIFDMLIKGIPPKEIAYNLHVAYDTILFHKKKIYQQLGVHSIHELVTKYGSVAKNEDAKKPEPEPVETVARKNALPLKLRVIFGILIFTVVLLFVLIFLRKPTDKAPVLDEGFPAFFSSW